MNEVTLEAMLDAREKRVQTIADLKKQFPTQSIISFKLNIPGPTKSTPNYQWAFKQGIFELDQFAKCYDCQLENHTGPEALLHQRFKSFRSGERSHGQPGGYTSAWSPFRS